MGCPGNLCKKLENQAKLLWDEKASKTMVVPLLGAPMKKMGLSTRGVQFLREVISRSEITMVTRKSKYCSALLYKNIYVDVQLRRRSYRPVGPGFFWKACESFELV
jgi:hypothetical protein